MGLDMYFLKTKRIEGYTPKDYSRVNEAMDYQTGEIKQCGVQKYQELKDSVVDRSDHPESYTFYSIFDEVGYLRKTNAIHRWFVDNVQGGNDNCELYEVGSKELNELLNVIDYVLEKPEEAENYLPPQSGFFFGSTEIDERYFKGLEETKDILIKILRDTDFEKEIVFYAGSW